MIEVFGDLRMTGPHGVALVAGNGARIAVRPPKTLRLVGLLRAIRWRSVQDLANRLDQEGLTFSVETPFLFAITLGREAEPGYLLRILGCRRLALGWRFRRALAD